jgi:hypothetical protein
MPQRVLCLKMKTGFTKECSVNSANCSMDVEGIQGTLEDSDVVFALKRPENKLIGF